MIKISSFDSWTPTSAASDMLVSTNPSSFNIEPLVVSSSWTPVSVRLLQPSRFNFSSFGSWTPTSAASDIVVPPKSSSFRIEPLVVSSSWTPVLVRLLQVGGEPPPEQSPTDEHPIKYRRTAILTNRQSLAVFEDFQVQLIQFCVVPPKNETRSCY